MQQDLRALSAETGGVAAECGAASKVEERKEGNLSTAELCDAAGITFCPVVFETYGACNAAGQLF